jgi:acetylornithine deacetylase
MDDVLDLLAALVAIDTTSREPNLPLLDLIEDRVDGLAADAFRIPDPTGTKANLVVRFGPDRPGGVVLSAHTDCVPVDGQLWSSDPFTLTRVDDRVVARGTADMKGFLACCVAATPRLAAADLQAPVWFAFSYDEELGALGAQFLVPAMQDAGADPDAVLVGEPTSMEPVIAHKSVRSFQYTFTGRPAHSSQPDAGGNAVVAAARVAAFVDDLATELQGEVDTRFDPPHTTFNVATIAGGTAINIIPDRCVLTFEYRALPSEDGPDLGDRVEAFARDTVLPALQRTCPEATLDITIPTPLPALHPEEDGAAERLARALTGTTAPARTAPFGTDAARFQQVGWSTVVCGPGNIEVAHRPDEWIGLDQLDRCRAMLDALAARLAAPQPA